MVLAAPLIVLLCAATPYDAVFEEANTAYEAGQYARACALYEQLAAEGVHRPEVFYNLGNAYFHSGRLGPAIANYERALHLRPGWERARVNLEQSFQAAERRIQRPLPPRWEQALLFWHYGLSPGLVRTLAVAFWWLFWALLAVRLWRPVKYLRVLAVCALILAAGFGLSTWAKAHPPLVAVASQERAPVRFGMRPGDAVHFELYAGDRVLVEERRDGWMLVSTADGQRGWAQSNDLTLVGPPYEAAPPEKKAGEEPDNAA